MKILGITVCWASICLSVVSAELPGDRWTLRRGDGTPGVEYQALTATSTGRLIAGGSGGQLMVSDDAGTTWTFRRLETPDRILNATVYDIQEFTVPATGQKRLVALSSWIEGAPAGDFENAAKTFVFRSDNDGETWVGEAFPFVSAPFRGQDYYGVNLQGLHVSPTGQLLAFGTTTVTNDFLVTWNMGGLIYRSNDGVTWELSEFAYGSLAEMADAAGRLVTVGSSTALDSAEGVGWNGYTLSNAQVLLPTGQPLDAAIVGKLRLLDVAVQNGTYAAQAVTFVPYDVALNIDSSTIDRRFMLLSTSPFGAGRVWTAYEQPSVWGKLFPTTTGLLAFGNGIFRSANLGESWTALNATVLARSGTVARTNAQTIVAVGSSEAAWRSQNDGASWTRVWTRAAGSNLRVQGLFGGTTLLAFGDSDLWASVDNGNSWQIRGAGVRGTNIVQTGGRLVLSTGQARLARTSDDLGFTWVDRPVDPASTVYSQGLVVTPTGRLILGARGFNVSNNGTFYSSDDQGVTWTPRIAGLSFGEEVRDLVVTQTGRIIAATNSPFSFNPRLFKSDDDGVTWTPSSVLRSLEGLDTVSNDPAQRVIQVGDIEVSPTGRLLIRGDDNELLTSDDNGDTWTVRVNQDFPQTPPNLFGAIYDVVRAGSRWVAIGSYQTPFPQSRRIHFTLTSDDDGTTWRRVPLPLGQTNTFLQYLSPARDGRVVATGTNAAVYTSDSNVPPPPESLGVTAREGESVAIPIARPPVLGAVQLRYSAVQGTALANSDFLPTAGLLDWAAGDTAPKTIVLPTVNNTTIEGPEKLTLEFVVNSTDVQAGSTMPVTIEDDDGGADAGVDLDGLENLTTTEAGGQAELRISLTRAPTADVTLAISGLDESEGSVALTALTFTPQNWNVRQLLVVSGVDDAFADGGTAYTLTFTTTSSDASFNGLPAVTASVLNLDDEPPTELPPPAPTPTPSLNTPPTLTAAAKFTGRNGKATVKGSVSANVVAVTVKSGNGKFKAAKLQGTTWKFKARGLDEGKTKATIQAVTANGLVVTKTVKILIE